MEYDEIYVICLCGKKVGGTIIRGQSFSFTCATCSSKWSGNLSHPCEEDKRSKYRRKIGWLWKLFGRCWHCGSSDNKDWNDHDITFFRAGHAGKECNHCGYVTERS